MSFVAVCFRHPLVHFLLIGVAVFALFGLVNYGDAIPSAQQIIVTEKKATQLANRFRSVWNRSPTQKELERLIDNFVKDEIMAREAIALSLDRDDIVIRQRLRQKMEFLTESAAGVLTPSDKELREYFDANADKYLSEPEMAFDQVFVGASPSSEDIDRVRSALEGGTDPSTTGAGTLLPASMPLSPKSVVDRTFGRSFFDGLANARSGEWAGPFKSGYGMHFVRVNERRDGGPASFKKVSDTVARDWRAEKSKEIAQELYSRMLARYAVTRPNLSSIVVPAK